MPRTGNVRHLVLALEQTHRLTRRVYLGFMIDWPSLTVSLNLCGLASKQAA
jgi:hypothetical protein